MRLRAVIQSMGGGFAHGSSGALGGCYRIALRLGFQIFIGKQQRTPGFAHVPFDIVGQHAEQDVGADSSLKPMVDGPDMQVDGFHRAECSFDFGKRLVAAHRLGAVHLFFGHAGADDVDAIERRFGGDLFSKSMEGEADVLDSEGEELGHLVLVNHRTHTDSDPVLTVECSLLDADADLLQFPLGRRE